MFLTYAIGALIIAFVIAAISAAAKWGGKPTLSLAVLALLLPLFYVSIVSSHGRPRPVGLWPNPVAGVKVTILWHGFRENEAIYIVGYLPDDHTPRMFSLPWNKDEAQELVDAVREGKLQEGGGQLILEVRGSGEEVDPVFYSEEIPASHRKPS